MSVNSAIRRSLLPIVGALMISVSPVALSAQENTQLTTANERINFAGKLRMLSQRIAGAGCNLSADVNVNKSVKILNLSRAEFEKILEGLQDGTGDLKIKIQADNTSALAALQAVVDQWQPMEAAVLGLLNDPGSASDLDVINSQNLDLLAAAQSLVQEVVAMGSSASEDDGGFGKLIDVSGRQRMLTQKMSKEACQIWSGDGAEETTTSLQATMQLFENSLNGLSNGSDELREPPNDEIERGLAGITQQWAAIKPTLERAAANEQVPPEERLKVTQDLNEALRRSNAVVGLYVVAKKERGNVDDIGATERVNYSGRLRMLSQRVAAAACNYHAGIETDASLSILTDAQAEFTKITQALEFGDADLNIKGGEKRRKTLAAVGELVDQWSVMDAAIDGLRKGDDAEGNVAIIKDTNKDVLAKAVILVSELSGQYSDPSVMLQSDALLVDISGRQRMFTQKMSKEACQVWSGNAAVGEDLGKTMQVFEASLLALLNGMETAGVKAAPTEEIMYGLDDLVENWEEIKPTLERAVGGEEVDAAVRAQVMGHLNEMLKDMNAVVGLYTIYGKTGL